MKDFCKRIVIFCITFIVLYTVAEIVLSFFMGMELSPTLTTCVYAFFGTELVSTAVIRVMKEKYNKDNSVEDNERSPIDADKMEIAPDYTPVEDTEEEPTAEQLINQLSQIKYE